MRGITEDVADVATGVWTVLGLEGAIGFAVMPVPRPRREVLITVARMD